MATVSHDNKTYKLLYCITTNCKMCAFWRQHRLYSSSIMYSPIHCYLCHYVCSSENLETSYNFVFNEDKMVATFLCKHCFENDKTLSKTTISYDINSIILKYIHLDDQMDD